MEVTEITYLVNHHDRQQIAYGGKEETIKIVISSFTNIVAEHIQYDLSGNKEEDAEHEISQWPSVLYCIDNKNNLHEHVDEDADSVNQIKHHKEPRRVRRRQSSPGLERQQRDGERDHENAETAKSQKPDRQGGPILVQLKPYKPIDEKTDTE